MDVFVPVRWFLYTLWPDAPLQMHLTFFEPWPILPLYTSRAKLDSCPILLLVLIELGRLRLSLHLSFLLWWFCDVQTMLWFLLVNWSVEHNEHFLPRAFVIHSSYSVREAMLTKHATERSLKIMPSKHSHFNSCYCHSRLLIY